MTPELQRKVDRAVKLIQQAGRDGQTVEVAYSGGKDSDVILELTRMAGIKYRAIYKNTTIDPPGTIAHAKENGVEIRQPKHRFFELVAMNGFPNRFARHCCRYIKEYKILDRNIMGVRKAESNKRMARYSEPTECRFYGSKKEHVEAFYPILDWSDQDVVDFIEARGIKVHALYYREDGTIDLGPLGTLYPSVTGPWKQDADELALTDMTPKATYQPSDEINQAIKGATLSWATEKDEKEGTETPANGDDNGGDDNGGENNGGGGNPGELEG